MPEFKNREEYETWKAEKVKMYNEKNSKTKTSEDDSIRKPVALAPKRNMRMLVLYFAIIAIAVFLSLYVYNFYKERAVYQAYKRDASATLIELEKLSAALEIGISYIDYTKKLGEINYSISAFLEKYKDYEIYSRPISYQVIKNSMDIYINLKKKWEIIIKSGDSYLLSITKDHIGKGWAAIGYHIKLTRQILEEKNKKSWKKLTAELVSAQEIWNNEDIDYHRKLDIYMAELQKNDDKMRSIIEDIKRDFQNIK